MSPEQQNDILSINKVQLLLSEKRTALSVMRTGIAVLALPLSIFSALIATSRWYNVMEVWPLLVLVVGINFGAGHIWHLSDCPFHAAHAPIRPPDCRYQIQPRFAAAAD